MRVFATTARGQFGNDVGVFNNRGDGFGCSMAFAILAAAALESPPSAVVVDKVVEILEAVAQAKTGFFPRMHNGLEFREGGGAIAALAIAWHTPQVMQRLDERAKARLRTVARASAVYAAIYLAEHDAQGEFRRSPQPELGGRLNVWTRSGPNYYEGQSLALFAAGTVLGVEPTLEYLSEFKLGRFTDELREAGYEDLAQRYESPFENDRFDMSTLEKKAAWIEGVLRGIRVNEQAGRLFYKGLSLRQVLEDPVRVQHTEATNFTFKYTATEGDYVGRQGALHELNSRDAGGLRDSSWYAASSLPATVLRQYLAEQLGYWRRFDDAQAKAAIRSLARVGWSDIHSRAFNGYWSRRLRQNAHDGLNTRWFRFTEAFAVGLGLAKERLFFDSFGNKASGGVTWDSQPGWTVVTSPTWTGRSSPPQPRKVMQSPTAPSAKLRAEVKLGDGHVHVHVKALEAADPSAAVGLALRTDAHGENGYLFELRPGGRSARIVVRDQGRDRVLAEQEFAMALDQAYLVQVRAKADRLAMLVDGREVVAASDATFASGDVGLYAHQAKAQFDNLFATAAEYVPTQD